MSGSSRSGLASFMALKNALIGGDFSSNPWQRGTSFSLGAAAAYTADRWYAYRASTVTGMTVARTTLTIGDIVGTLHSLRAQRDNLNASTNALNVQQSIESANSRLLSGKTCALTFWARKGANFSGTLTANVYSGTGTDENVKNGFTGTATVMTSALTLSTSWTKFTVVGTFGNINQAAVEFAHAPSGTAGANDWYEIALVQLAPVSVGLDFEHRHPGAELELCQRYYEKSFDLTTAPAQGVGSYIGSTFSQVSNGTGTWMAHAKFATSKRVAPSITTYNPISANAQAYDSTRAADGSATSADLIGTSCFRLVTTPPGTAANGDHIACHWAANSEI